MLGEDTQSICESPGRSDKTRVSPTRKSNDSSNGNPLVPIWTFVNLSVGSWDTECEWAGGLRGPCRESWSDPLEDKLSCTTGMRWLSVCAWVCGGRGKKNRVGMRMGMSDEMRWVNWCDRSMTKKWWQKWVWSVDGGECVKGGARGGFPPGTS